MDIIANSRSVGHQFKSIKDPEALYFNIFSDTSRDNHQANALQKKLNRCYKLQLGSAERFSEIPDTLDEISELRAIENAWNRYLDSRIKTDMPKSKQDFKAWYLSVNEDYKVSAEPFFNYFSKKASIEELALYLIFEQQVDGSFDDIVALAQLGLQGKAKMILAENYWDEMGNGNARDVHTDMFATSVSYLRSLLEKSPRAERYLSVLDHTPTAIFANGNMLLMYATRRKFIPKLLGAIAILENTAPHRFKSTVSLMKKHQLPEDVLRYHEVHVCCDCRHGEDLLEHVLLPLIAAGDEKFLHEVCKGVIVRLQVALEYYKCMQETFDALR